MPSATTPLATGREGGGGGAPSQKTFRPPPTRTPRGRRIRVPTFSRTARGCGLRGHAARVLDARCTAGRRLPGHRRRGQRQGHDPAEAEADRLALPDGDRVALRHRRRRAGRRRRRPVGLPEGARRAPASPASRRTSRRSPSTGPTSSSSSYDANSLVASLKKLHIPVILQDGAARLCPGAYEQIKQLGRATGHYDRARDGRRADDGRRSPRLVAASTTARTRRLALPRAQPRLLLRDVEDVHRLASTRSSACATSPTRRTRPAPATRSSPAEYSIASNPGLIVLADVEVLRADGRRLSGAARAGTGSARSGTARSSCLDDSIASRWGPRVVNFVRAVSSAVADERPQLT